MSNRREEAKLIANRIYEAHDCYDEKDWEITTSKIVEAIISFSNESVRQEREEIAELMTKYFMDRADDYDGDGEAHKRDLHGYYSMDTARAIRNRQGGEM